MLAQFLHLPGVSEPASDSEEWKRSMYIVVYDVIAALARQRPLLYVLEDLHFADAASLTSCGSSRHARRGSDPVPARAAPRPGSPEPRRRARTSASSCSSRFPTRKRRASSKRRPTDPRRAA
jgi:hypothetical protein